MEWNCEFTDLSCCKTLDIIFEKLINNFGRLFLSVLCEDDPVKIYQAVGNHFSIKFSMFAVEIG